MAASFSDASVYQEAASTETEQVNQVDSEVAKKLEHVHFSSTIKLNVGGQVFTTSLQTLTKDAGSMLHAMFSGGFDTKPAEDGSYFIDRDGTHFRIILNYLRTGKLIVPKDDVILKEVLEEAKFYQIQGIIDKLSAPLQKTQETREPANHLTILYSDSDILSPSQCIWLTAIHGNNKFKKSVLLYRGSRDGWKAQNFHSKCDSFDGPTMAVMESMKGFVFGGYTEKSWAGLHAQFKKDRAAFLFTLGNNIDVTGHVLTLKAVKNPGNAIRCFPNCGLRFGGDQDLLIDTRSNGGLKYGSTNVCHTFEVPQGHSGETVLAGENEFELCEIEVYGLLQT